MTDTAKRIIPDENAVIRCLDPEMLEALGSHKTFIISELIEELKKLKDPTISMQKLSDIFYTARTDGDYNVDKFKKNISESIAVEPTIILNMLIEGKTCSLLQPDGKGWQEGKIKICLEFIPEETELVENKSNSIQAEHSPLDEIRNSLVEGN